MTNPSFFFFFFFFGSDVINQIHIRLQPLNDWFNKKILNETEFLAFFIAFRRKDIQLLGLFRIRNTSKIFKEREFLLYKKLTEWISLFGIFELFFFFICFFFVCLFLFFVCLFFVPNKNQSLIESLNADLTVIFYPESLKHVSSIFFFIEKKRDMIWSVKIMTEWALLLKITKSVLFF